MKLEDQVCSLELAKRLKKLLGLNKTLFYWYDRYNNGEICVESDLLYKAYVAIDTDEYESVQRLYPAYTASELGELLPIGILTEKTKLGYEIGRRVISLNDIDKYRREFVDHNESNARAKMLIYLIEKGNIKC